MTAIFSSLFFSFVFIIICKIKFFCPVAAATIFFYIIFFFTMENIDMCDKCCVFKPSKSGCVLILNKLYFFKYFEKNISEKGSKMLEIKWWKAKNYLTKVVKSKYLLFAEKNRKIQRKFFNNGRKLKNFCLNLLKI